MQNVWTVIRQTVRSERADTLNILNDLGEHLLFFDGAMGTLLQENGLGAGELPELWNLTHPEVVTEIHRSYLAAGANLLKTNTFGANALKMKDTGHTVEEVVTAAVKLAKEAAKDTTALVGMDIGPTGKLLKPLGDLGFEKAYAVFKEMAFAGAAAGADFIIIETISDTYECKAAVLAAKENTSLPVFATLIFDEYGKLLTGGTIASAVAMLEGLGADAIGFNCGLGPDQMKRLLPELKACCSIPIIVNPNAGLPHDVDGKTVFNVDPQEFSTAMEEIARGGAWMIGGCCGTTPEHISAMTARCREIPPVPLTPQHSTVVSSAAKAVVFGERPVLIGERINPTGKSRFKQALREHDIDFILREGITQQENGADILDVNVGLPEIDESEMMKSTVTELQAVVDLPLQIDTSSPEVMETALRLYNGKALINSVNGKEESMRSIFPLVKKYGGAVIALTLDENGIPDTAEGRLSIAEKIVSTAEQYGIDRKEIIVDPLAMTISAGQQNAAVTLQSLKLIRDTLGVHTSLGVSNISFGLPQRENINAAFFTMAMQNGLSAAIINPGSQAMMSAYYSFCALSGSDAQCAAYIQRFAGQASAPIPASAEITLHDAIVKGLKDSAFTAAEKLLPDTPALEIINTQLVPALDQVGNDFEKGTLFLPQLLMSAEAAKSAFEAIRRNLGAGGESVKKDKIILATVKGDIHDIGKNIVKVLLENYSYDVIDLGKDVPPEEVVSAAEESGAKLVGLSALMTTTVANMKETIRQLHQSVPDCKIMVGGAVLTPEYAQMIQADHYARDAMGAVRYANKMFGQT